MEEAESSQSQHYQDKAPWETCTGSGTQGLWELHTFKFNLGTAFLVYTLIDVWCGPTHVSTILMWLRDSAFTPRLSSSLLLTSRRPDSIRTRSPCFRRAHTARQYCFTVSSIYLMLYLWFVTVLSRKRKFVYSQ